MAGLALVNQSSPPGVSATVALLALERIGVHADGIYDGSFNEWSADDTRPIAYGAVE